MNLETFLSKNQISLPQKTHALCKEAIQTMKKSRDLLHKDNHIFRLLDSLDKLLEKDQKLDKSQIDIEVLLLSICWHDAWRAKRVPRNYFLMFFDDLFEGIGSMFMFAKSAKEANLSKNLANQVKYAIRKHSRFQILPIKTTEAKILSDVDYLDLFSMERANTLKRKYLSNPKKINLKLLKLAKFYFDHFLARIKASTFYYQWSKSEFMRRREILVNEVNNLVSKYCHLAQRGPLTKNLSKILPD